jgi:Beta-lactamase class C and other penicillin binding proteins
MKGGEVLHMKGYGVADLASGQKVDADSLFDLASLSKQMTALVAMLQIKDGLYGEKTPISKLLPVFAQTEFEGRAVTVGDLVHHLSGLTDYLSGDESFDYGAQTTNAQVLEWLAKQRQDHAAGEKLITPTAATSRSAAWSPRQTSPTRCPGCCTLASGTSLA